MSANPHPCIVLVTLLIMLVLVMNDDVYRRLVLGLTLTLTLLIMLVLLVVMYTDGSRQSSAKLRAVDDVADGPYQMSTTQHQSGTLPILRFFSKI